MNKLTLLALTFVAAVPLSAAAAKPAAQVSVDIGVAPDCPYGYYDYAPYACAPYGYYGPEWFTGGDVRRSGSVVSRGRELPWPREQPLRCSPRAIRDQRQRSETSASPPSRLIT